MNPYDKTTGLCILAMILVSVAWGLYQVGYAKGHHEGKWWERCTSYACEGTKPRWDGETACVCVTAARK